MTDEDYCPYFIYLPAGGAIAFYHHTLGLPVTEHSATAMAFQVGHTQLRFEYRPGAVPYHFAINIPYQQVDEAHQWLRERVTLLPDEHGELIDFSNWNALALYAYDGGGNIVEWIGRRDIPAIGLELFSAAAFMGISEIGVVTEGVAPVYDALNDLAPLPVYDGSFDRFCAAGDPEGLFIIIDKRRKQWFPTLEEAHVGDFTMRGDYNFSYIQGRVVGE